MLSWLFPSLSELTGLSFTDIVHLFLLTWQKNAFLGQCLLSYLLFTCVVFVLSPTIFVRCLSKSVQNRVHIDEFTGIIISTVHSSLSSAACIYLFLSCSFDGYDYECINNDLTPILLSKYAAAFSVGYFLLDFSCLFWPSAFTNYTVQLNWLDSTADAAAKEQLKRIESGTDSTSEFDESSTLSISVMKERMRAVNPATQGPHRNGPLILVGLFCHHSVCTFAETLVFLTHPRCTQLNSFHVSLEMSTLTLNLYYLSEWFECPTLYAVFGWMNVVFYPLNRLVWSLYLVYLNVTDFGHFFNEHIGANSMTVGLIIELVLFLISAYFWIFEVMLKFSTVTDYTKHMKQRFTDIQSSIHHSLNEASSKSNTLWNHKPKQKKQ